MGPGRGAFSVPDPVSRFEGGFYPRIFALVTVGVLGFALIRMIQPFVGSILWAVLLAFMLAPLNDALARVLGGRRGLAALLITIASLVLILLPATLLGVAFVNQAGDLVTRLQEFAARQHISGLGDVLRVPVLDRLIQSLGAYVPVNADRIQSWLVESGQSGLRALVLASGAVFAGALGAVVQFLLTLFLLFFFLRDGEEIVRRVVRLVPLDPGRKATLIGHLAAVTRAVVLGTLLTAVAQGVLLGLGFAIVGLPSPVVFGALTGIASLVPLIGTALVWVPAVVVLVVQGRPGAAVFLLIWSVILVGMADNFLKPLVVSGRAQISTLPVFLGLMGGLSAFGAIGMVLGPVIVALVIALFRFAEESQPAEASPVDRDSQTRPVPLA
jgi:predicted PurR-regulated permease PerM